MLLNRRQFLTHSAAVGAAVAGRCSLAETEDVTALTLSQAAQALAEGAFSAHDYASALLVKANTDIC